MNKKRIFGLILLGVGIIVSFPHILITGAVVGIDKLSVFKFFGSLIILIGTVLLASAEIESLRRAKTIKRLEQDFESGRIGTYNELRGDASRLGFEVSEGGSHTIVRDQRGHIVAVIPRHQANINRAIYRKIAKQILEHYVGR